MKRPTHVDNEDPIVSRITDILIKRGISQKTLVEQLGLRKTAYTEWKAGRSASYRQYIDQIAAFLNVSPTYLLRGEEGSVFSTDEIGLVEAYRAMDEQDKKKLKLWISTQRK